MDSILSKSLITDDRFIFQFDLAKPLAAVRLTYDLDDSAEHYTFATVTNIDKINVYPFVRQQREHFLQYLTYFNNGTYSWKEYKSIHLVGKVDDRIVHYLQMDNNNHVVPDFAKPLYPSVQPTVVHCDNRIFIEYRPELFPDYKWNMSYLTFKKWRHNSVAQAVDVLTVLNCSIYGIICVLKNIGGVGYLSEHPFWGAWHLITTVGCYGTVGGFLANFKPWLSHIVINCAVCLASFSTFDKHLFLLPKS